MLVLLDTTILTNLALVGLTSIPKDLWGDKACTTSEVLEECAAGVATGNCREWIGHNWKSYSCLPMSRYLEYRGFLTLEEESVFARS